jgi:hypothetical protein
MEQLNNTGKISVTALFAFKAQNTDEVGYVVFFKNYIVMLLICLVIIF